MFGPIGSLGAVRQPPGDEMGNRAAFLFAHWFLGGLGVAFARARSHFLRRAEPTAMGLVSVSPGVERCRALVGPETASVDL
eukprot:1191624-Pyramimonas_sp.AAC.1